jgi:hypothetical protein
VAGLLNAAPEDVDLCELFLETISLLKLSADAIDPAATLSTICERVRPGLFNAPNTQTLVKMA